MKKILAVVLFISAFILNNLNADAIYVSGSVNGVWDSDSVKVRGDIHIEETDSLIIMPGTIVQFQSNYSFNVFGTLLSIGAENDSILFTIKDTIGFTNIYQEKGGWKSIRFLPNSEKHSVIDYNIIQFSKSVLDTDTLNINGGGIYINNYNSVSVSNSVFKNNYAFSFGGGLYADNSEIDISNTVFSNNRCGSSIDSTGMGGGAYFMNCSPVIYDSYFSHNTAVKSGGGIAFYQSGGSVERCEFIRNKTVTMSGGGFLSYFSDVKLNGNLFRENYGSNGGGLSFFFAGYEQTTSNNLIIYNNAEFFGGGIICFGCAPKIVNNTVCSNSAVYGGGMDCYMGSPLTVNNVFWNNTAYSNYGHSIYLWDYESEPVIKNCVVEYGEESEGIGGSGSGINFTGEYIDNIEIDPMLDSLYNLLEGSPCINSGIADTSGLNLPDMDIMLNPRILNGRIDIGAYESNYTDIEENSDLNVFLLKNSPNPFNPETNISFKLYKDTKIKLNIYNINGKLVKTIVNHSLLRGDYNYIWNGRDENDLEVSSGIFFYKLKTDYGEETRKMLFLK